MNNLATWLVKDRIVLTSIIGDLTIHDFEKLDKEVIALFEESPYDDVHVLADISYMKSMPSIFEMAKLKHITHPQIGFFVTQSRNSVEEFIGSTVGKILKTKYKFVHTLDEGIIYLSQIDDTLPSVEEMTQQAYALRDSFAEKYADQLA
ncbi:MAG: hypothetical protein AAF846_18965 [Chloroflexota bacterium]